MTQSVTDTASTTDKKRKPLGWKGITGMVPWDWDLAAVSDTPTSGYIGLDDDLARRMEIKWARAKKMGQMQAGEMLTHYLKSMRKNLEKGQTLDVVRDARIMGEERFPPQWEKATYMWEHADGVGLGVVWHCPDCKQVLMAQVQGPRNNFNLRTASDVLTSLRCHSESDMQRWAIFDFSFECPKSFVMQKHVMQSGLLTFELHDGANKLYVERIGMADMILKHTDPTVWVPQVHWKKAKRKRLNFEETSLGSHTGWRISGEKWRLVYLLPSTISDFFRRVLKRDWIHGRMWVCEEANRLFIVRAEGPQSEALEELVAGTINCHTEVGGE